MSVVHGEEPAKVTIGKREPVGLAPSQPGLGRHLLSVALTKANLVVGIFRKQENS